MTDAHCFETESERSDEIHLKIDLSIDISLVILTDHVSENKTVEYLHR